MERDRDRLDAEDDVLEERLPRDTGVIGSEAEERGPGRDTARTDPDPVSESVEQPRTTVAMSEADPVRTRLGAQEEDVEPIGAAAPELARDLPGDEEDLAAERPRRYGDDEDPPAT